MDKTATSDWTVDSAAAHSGTSRCQHRGQSSCSPTAVTTRTSRSVTVHQRTSRGVSIEHWMAAQKSCLRLITTIVRYMSLLEETPKRDTISHSWGFSSSCRQASFPAKPKTFDKLAVCRKDLVASSACWTSGRAGLTRDVVRFSVPPLPPPHRGGFQGCVRVRPGRATADRSGPSRASRQACPHTQHTWGSLDGLRW